MATDTGYGNRKEQIDDFIRRARLGLKNKAARERFHKAMRDACMVGACEERRRCLRIIERYGATRIISEIVEIGVLKMLGFED